MVRITKGMYMIKKYIMLTAACGMMFVNTPAFAVVGNNGGGNGGCGVGQQTNGCGDDSNSGGISSVVNNAVRNDIDVNNTNRNTNENNAFSVAGAYASGGDSKSTSNSDQSQSSSVENNVNIEGDSWKRNPVSTAFATPLVAGSDTCMGSTSAGGQAVSFGFSFGTTWKDKNCMRLKNARELYNMGLRSASTQLMCLDADVRKAMAAANTPCEDVIENK